jgi:lipopolysaccharide/colanic/teichoic acid biosynthesis glycosyltransferase
MRKGFDIVIAIVLMVIGVLIFLLIYPLHKYLTRSSLLFKQIRVGESGLPFICYKVTSIFTQDSIPDYLLRWASSYSDFIRKYKIDEIPQFYNIIRGEMSAVGPRPLMPAEVADYYVISPNATKRHRVLPGLTGLSQICVLESNVKTEGMIRKKVSLDNWYCENQSTGLYIKILLGTAKYILSQKTQNPKDFGCKSNDELVIDKNPGPVCTDIGIDDSTIAGTGTNATTGGRKVNNNVEV